MSVVTTVKVYVATEGSLHYAWSDDVRGMNLASRSREKLEERIPKAIKKLYRLNHGIDVSVFPLSPRECFPTPVRFPDRFVISAESTDPIASAVA